MRLSGKEGVEKGMICMKKPLQLEWPEEVTGRGVLVMSYQRVVKIGRGTTKVLKFQTEMVARWMSND